MLLKEKLTPSRFPSWCNVFDDNVVVLMKNYLMQVNIHLLYSPCIVLKMKANSSYILIMVHYDWWQCDCARWKTTLWKLTQIAFHSSCNDLRTKGNSSYNSITEQWDRWWCGCVRWKTTLWKLTHISFHSSCHVVRRKANSR